MALFRLSLCSFPLASLLKLVALDITTPGHAIDAGGVGRGALVCLRVRAGEIQWSPCIGI
jgi:hypothetical protein